MSAQMKGVLVLLSLLAAGCPANSPGPSIGSFAAAPATIHPGQKSTLSWSVAGATSISIDPGLGPQIGTSVDVAPTETTTYTLNAAGAGGSASAQAVVTVLPSAGGPAITAFTASPGKAPAGGSVTLAWTVSGQIDSLKVDPGAIDVLADTNRSTGSGSRVLTGVFPPITYTLTASNSGGSENRTASVALSAGKHLQYTDPTSTTSKLLLVRNGASTDSHLILDVKVGAAALTAFGVALNIPFDPASAGMISVPGSNAIMAGTINFGSGPATAGSLLGGPASAMPNVFTAGVAKKKATAADGDDTWPAGATLFSIAFDMAPSAAGGTNVFTASALATNARFKALALKKDGSAAACAPAGLQAECAAAADIAIGELIISN